MAQTNVAQTNVVQTNVAQTNVAQTNVAQTNVVQTNVAQTNVAQTNVVQSAVAQVNATPHVQSAVHTCPDCNNISQIRSYLQLKLGTIAALEEHGIVVKLPHLLDMFTYMLHHTAILQSCAFKSLVSEKIPQLRRELEPHKKTAARVLKEAVHPRHMTEFQIAEFVEAQTVLRYADKIEEVFHALKLKLV